MQLRVKGMTVTEIATALGTNKRTVQRYLKPASTEAVAKSEIKKFG
jgi:predicted transcriptional regulator